MSKQQIVLLIVASSLAFAAVPGLIMGVPDRVQAPASDQTKKAFQSVPPETPSGSVNDFYVDPPASVPKTTLNLQKTTGQEKEEIRFARKININEASNEELQKIPGVGPATAERIVKFRKQGNQFFRVEDMTRIKLIGKRTVEKLKPHVTVGKEYLRQQDNQHDDGKVDLNTADASELQTLPGVGKTIAGRIIRYRQQYGGFRSVSDIKSISGIGGVTYDRLKNKVKASSVTGIRSPSLSGSFESSASSSSGGSRININSASSSELQQLAGVGPATAEKIIDYREQNGSFSSIDELDNVSGIGPATLEKIRPQTTAN